MGKSNKESEWWDESIELVSGCTPVSKSCEYCWSASNTHRFRGRLGLTDKGHFNGKVIFNEKALEKLRKGKDKKIIIWNDLFHESVSFNDIENTFSAIHNSKNIFQVLTKRPNRMKEYIEGGWCDENNFAGEGPLIMEEWPNLWLGVTVENQRRADELITILLQIPAAVRFISVTLMGPIDFEYDYGIKNDYCGEREPKEIDWVIIECLRLAGNRAGPGTEDEVLWWQWAKDIVDQCKAADVAVWFKQGPLNGKVTDRLEDFPSWARLRELPNV